jgi:Na+/H+-dicarboxylate symporter
MHLPIPAANASSGVTSEGLSLETLISHAIPTSIFDAMSRNEILQIVVFSLFFGTALAALGERAKGTVQLLDVLSHAMLKVTGYVMMFRAVCSLRRHGEHRGEGRSRHPACLWPVRREFYLGIVILWLVLIGLGVLVIGPSVLRLVRRIREAVLLAFSTASSERPTPRRSRSSSGSASAIASRASCCRSATRSTSTAR